MSVSSLAEAICAANVAGRNPTKQEFLSESPAGQRAIMARWMEIKNSTCENWDEFANWSLALARWQWAYKQTLPLQTVWYEDYIQGDYDKDDSRFNYERGE